VAAHSSSASLRELGSIRHRVPDSIVSNANDATDESVLGPLAYTAQEQLATLVYTDATDESVLGPLVYTAQEQLATLVYTDATDESVLGPLVYTAQEQLVTAQSVVHVDRIVTKEVPSLNTSREHVPEHVP
jgi:hypothetical protein